MTDRFFTMISSVKHIINVLESFQNGSVLLQSGSHAVEIITRKTPVDLWISLKEVGNIPVCNGDINKFSYTLTNDGFVLYTDIVSETAQIEWQAFFDMEEGV